MEDSFAHLGSEGSDSSEELGADSPYSPMSSPRSPPSVRISSGVSQAPGEAPRSPVPVEEIRANSPVRVTPSSPVMVTTRVTVASEDIPESSTRRRVQLGAFSNVTPPASTVNYPYSPVTLPWSPIPEMSDTSTPGTPEPSLEAEAEAELEAELSAELNEEYRAIIARISSHRRATAEINSRVTAEVNSFLRENIDTTQNAALARLYALRARALAGGNPPAAPPEPPLANEAVPNERARNPEAAELHSEPAAAAPEIAGDPPVIEDDTPAESSVADRGIATAQPPAAPAAAPSARAPARGATVVLALPANRQIVQDVWHEHEQRELRAQEQEQMVQLLLRQSRLEEARARLGNAMRQNAQRRRRRDIEDGVWAARERDRAERELRLRLRMRADRDDPEAAQIPQGNNARVGNSDPTVVPRQASPDLFERFARLREEAFNRVRAEAEDGEEDEEEEEEVEEEDNDEEDDVEDDEAGEQEGQEGDPFEQEAPLREDHPEYDPDPPLFVPLRREVQEAQVEMQMILQDEEMQRARNPVGENATERQLQLQGLPGEGVQPNSDVQLNSSTQSDDFQQAPNVLKRKKDEGAEELKAWTDEEEPSDTLSCPICMEPWTNTGDHRICALACGHLYGRSCILRWLQQSVRKLGKCPQCNKKAKKEDLRTLFVPRVAVVDGEGQKLAKELQYLRNENYWLKAEKVNLQKQLEDHEKKMVLARLAMRQSFDRPQPPAMSKTLNINRSNCPPGSDFQLWPVDDPRSRIQASSDHGWCTARGTPADRRPSSDPPQVTVVEPMDRFLRQNEVPLLGGKVFDMEPDSLTAIFSNKVEEGDGSSRYGLCKMSLLACTEIEQICLPRDFGIIRDLRLSTFGYGGPGKLALVASLGRRVSVVSTETNNIVHSYPVKSPPWSCAWDPQSPHVFYTGLQDGSVLALDLRRTLGPVAKIEGCNNRPVHTLHVVRDHSGARTSHGEPVSQNTELLSASVAGIYRWNLGVFDEGLTAPLRPKCIYSAKDKFCTSLAYDCLTDTAVASIKHVPLADNNLLTGQNMTPSDATPSLEAIAQEDASYWIFSRGNGNGNNSGLGMSSEAISNIGGSGNATSWQWVGGMSGHKNSTSLMPRSAIVSKSRSTPGSTAWFAGGDDGTNSVWLWDMDTRRVTQTLLPHESPVLDIKHINMNGTDLLGCLSDRTFRLYKKQVRSY